MFMFRPGFLTSQRRHALPVAQHESDKLACRPVPGHVAPGFGEAAEEPSEIEAVCPHGNLNLVAAEECDGGSNAMNRGHRFEIPLQIKAQLFLCASTQGNDDMGRPVLANGLQEHLIFDRTLVERRDIHVLGKYVDALLTQPDKIPGRAVGIRHDPECPARFAHIGAGEQFR